MEANKIIWVATMATADKVGYRRREEIKYEESC